MEGPGRNRQMEVLSDAPRGGRDVRGVDGGGRTQRRLMDQVGDAGMIEALQERIAALEARLAERTSELAEARQQQTATADVLRVIGRGHGELHAVLMALA